MKFSANLSSFLSDSIIYTLLNLFNKVIPFILLPILIRTVSTADFGMYSLFITIESVLVPIISFNIYAALSRHYYIEGIPLKSYLSTITIAQIILISGFIGLIYFLPENFKYLIGLSSQLLTLVVITAGTMSIINLTSTLFRLQRKPLKYGIYSVIQSILLLSITILFALWQPTFEMLVTGRVTFFLIFLIGTLGMLKYCNLLTFTFDKIWFLRILKFSLPTVLYSISAFLFLSSDRFLIKFFLGNEALAYYAAIFQIASIISILGMSLNAAWMPWLFENLKKQEEKINIFIVKLSYGLMLGFLIVGVVFCLLYSFIAKIILPEQYHTHLSIAYPLIMGYVFEGVYLIVSPYIFYKEKTKYNGLIGVFIAFFNIMLNIILIPQIGIQGAAYSTFFTWFLLSTLFFIVSNKVYPMPWFFFLNRFTIKRFRSNCK